VTEAAHLASMRSILSWAYKALDDLDALVLFDIGDGNLDTVANPLTDNALFSLFTIFS